MEPGSPPLPAPAASLVPPVPLQCPRGRNLRTEELCTEWALNEPCRDPVWTLKLPPSHLLSYSSDGISKDLGAHLGT